MNCQNARLLMSEWLDARLDANSIVGLREHMTTCPNCRAHWHALQHVSSVFQSADVAMPPPDFTARVMQRIQAAQPVARRPLLAVRTATLAWGTLAATLFLLCTMVVFYGSTPSQPGSASGPSLNFVSLSMQISDSAIQAATAVGGAISIASRLGDIVPRPALVLIFAWLGIGTIALSITVASLVAAYQPVSVGDSQKRDLNRIA
jgi:predicted anti-sigma-YlaC factor YlaD